MPRLVIQRLCGRSGQLDEAAQWSCDGRVGGVLATGNEDGGKHCSAQMLYALSHIGLTIPPQADAYWIGEAGPGPSYLDDDRGAANHWTTRNTVFAARNLLHTARLLRDAGGVPAHGNITVNWDLANPTNPNPDYRACASHTDGGDRHASASRPTTAPHRRNDGCVGATRAIGLSSAALLLAAACAAGDPQPPSGPVDARTLEYLPGVAADVHEPSGQPRAVVVMLPGGSWVTADRAGLTPLAQALAEAGFLAVNATYRAAADGATYPAPVQDVRCAIGFAAAQASGRGSNGPIVVLGHSAGGHLAAVAALGDPGSAPGCPYPTPDADGLIGLAGVYDTAEFEFVLVELFGTSRAEDPDTWSSADPVLLARAGTGPNLATLLLHGDRDAVVPVAQSETFAAALESSGRAVDLEIIPSATHDTVYSVDVAVPVIRGWLDRLVRAGSTRSTTTGPGGSRAS